MITMFSWGTPSTSFCWTSCGLLWMFILFEVREIIMLKVRICIYVREKHWAANGSHAHKSDTWWKFQHGQTSNLLWEILLLNCLKNLKRSPFVCCPCLPGMDVQKLRKNSPWNFVQEAWRYPFVTLGKNNMHMKKVFGNL